MTIGAIIIFGVLALVVVGSAIGLLLSRNAVYAALFLVINFVAVGLLYLALGAPFIALAQVTVYAGSIMVLFMFVIMLLGAEHLPLSEPLRGQRVLGVLLGVAFLAEIVLYVLLRGGNLDPIPAVSLDFASPAAIGTLLFEKYLLPFEITSFILLAAVIGAIILTKTDKPSRRDVVQTRPEEPKEV